MRNLSRILSASVNVFLYFTISHKFKSNSKHSSVFFTCFQELFPCEVATNTFVNSYFWLLSENLSFFKKQMKSTSSFSVSKFKTESLFLSLINVERVLLIRLCGIQCLQQHLPQNCPVHVFSSLWEIYNCITATMAVINYPVWPQPKLFPQWELRGESVVWPHLMYCNWDQ